MLVGGTQRLMIKVTSHLYNTAMLALSILAPTSLSLFIPGKGGTFKTSTSPEGP